MSASSSNPYPEFFMLAEGNVLAFVMADVSGDSRRPLEVPA